MPDVSTEVAIATTTLGSAASTITFNSISSAYTDLRLVFVGTSDTGTPYANLRFNGDTGINYSSTFMQATGSVATSVNYSDTNAMLIAANNTLSTTIPIMYEVDLFSYAGSVYKTILSKGSGDKNGTGIVDRFVGLWRSTSAINSITLYTTANNFATGTKATLYGIL